MNPEALIAKKSTGNGAAHSPEETARAVASLMAKADHLDLMRLFRKWVREQRSEGKF